MKRKSIAEIHQQTLDIIARLGMRRHTSSESFLSIMEIHNRYIRNICDYFGVNHPSVLSDTELALPIPATTYATK